jgi:hypothetical protein
MRKTSAGRTSVTRSWLMPLGALALAGSLAGCVAYPAYPSYGYGGYGYDYGPSVAYVGPPVVVGGGWGHGGWGGGWHDGGGWHEGGGHEGGGLHDGGGRR